MGEPRYRRTPCIIKIVNFIIKPGGSVVHHCFLNSRVVSSNLTGGNWVIFLFFLIIFVSLGFKSSSRMTILSKTCKNLQKYSLFLNFKYNFLNGVEVSGQPNSPFKSWVYHREISNKTIDIFYCWINTQKTTVLWNFWQEILKKWKNSMTKLYKRPY